MNPKKVYFAGSIRGGRDYATLYTELISYIKSKNAIVLTEHIGDNNLLKQERALTDKEIYLRD